VDSWIPTTAAVILSESNFCGNFVGKREYIEAGGLLLQISKNLKIPEQTILEQTLKLIMMELDYLLREDITVIFMCIRELM